MKAEFGYVSAYYLTLQSRILDVHHDHLSKEVSVPISLCFEFLSTKPMKYYIQKRDGLWFHHLNCIKSIMVMLTVPFYTVLDLNKECH